MQRSRDVLFFFASEVSRVAQLLLCLVLQRSLTVYSLLSKWKQELLVDQVEVKIISITAIHSHTE